MIWMIQGDVLAADGMVMYNLSVLHSYNKVCIKKSHSRGDSFFSSTFVGNREAYM